MAAKFIPYECQAVAKFSVLLHLKSGRGSESELLETPVKMQWKSGSFVKIAWMCLLLGVATGQRKWYKTISGVEIGLDTDVAETRVLTVGVGKTVSLQCHIRFVGEHLEDRYSTYIRWLKNWEGIDYNERIYYNVGERRSSSELSFNTTVAEDSGVYTCYASLNSSRRSDSVTLNVEVEKPTAPKLIRAVCGHSNFARVDWKPGPRNNATFVQFIIEHTNSYTPDVWTQVTVVAYGSSGKDNILILAHGMNYTFRVLSEGLAGLSLPSNHSEICTTASRVPGGHPDGVQITEDSPGKLVISWHQMDYNHLNGPGFFYRVIWKAEKNKDFLTQDVHDWKQTRLVVSVSPNLKLYVAKVEAHNSVGKALDEAEICVSDASHPKARLFT